MSTKKASKSQASSKKNAPVKGAQHKPLLDTRLKNDIVGVLVALVALVLLVAIIVPGDAVLAAALSVSFKMGFGLGAFALPFALLIWCASLFVRERLANSPVRLALGLVLIFLALVTLLALSTPLATSDPSMLFDAEQLSLHGGYLGAGPAWATLTLVGPIIGVLIFVAIAIIGLIVIGFSVTGLIAKIAGAFGARSKPELLYDDKSAYKEALTPAGSSRKRKKELIAPTTLLDTDSGDNGFVFNADANNDSDTILLDNADLGATRRLNRKTDKDKKSSKKTEAKKKVAANSEEPQLQRLSDFELPSMEILHVNRDKAATKAGVAELKSTAQRLQATFEEFGVDGEVVGWIAGPSVTRYKVAPGEGVRLNRITNLQDDIQLALAALAVRIVAPIPGTSLVGIEVPNEIRNAVLLGDVLAQTQDDGALDLAVGKDVDGSPVIADLAQMPHLLIGGTTGSGKSVAINAMIMSILMRHTPEEVRLILIDPKRVELGFYNGIPHLYVPVVTDPAKAAAALAWAVVEMERRLKLFEQVGVKNIKQYNKQYAEQAAMREAACAISTDNTDGSADASDASGDSTAGAKSASPEDLFAEHMPYIVIVIDELADLMMVAGKEIESSIVRLAQLARAAGLHLIVATQRPSSTVITGLIKANIVNRIAFTVATGIDSRVILDSTGAEKLIGKGDLLFSRPEYSKPVRIQGCIVTEQEIETVVNFLRSQGEPDYHDDIFLVSGSGIASGGGVQGSLGQGGGGDHDPLLWEAAEIIVSAQLGSTSALQRRLKVGYARAGRIMDELEDKGIVGSANGSKPREVFIDDILDLETLRALETQMNDEW